MTMPSDPASKSLRLNTKDPDYVPEVLPRGFNTNF